MNINPFDIIKNLGNLQNKVGEIQEKLGNLSVVGSSGGGMVTVTMNGRFEVLAVGIAPEVVDPRDPEMLQDLVRSAVSDALFRIKEAIRAEMPGLAGGLNLPPGMMGL